MEKKAEEEKDEGRGWWRGWGERDGEAGEIERKEKAGREREKGGAGNGLQKPRRPFT